MKQTALFSLLICSLFVLPVCAQTITGDSVNINPTGTATSSANYTSGALNLIGSGWNSSTSSATPLTFQMRHLAEPFLSTLQFSLLPNAFGDPWTRTTVKFVGPSMGFEVVDVVSFAAARMSSFGGLTLLAVRNNLPWQNGIVPANSFRNMFAASPDGKVGSLQNVAYEFDMPTFRNLLDDGAGNAGIGTSTPAAQLHTTGSVRFAGLTANAAAPRVVTMDSTGNLSYRDAGSFGAGNWSVTGNSIYNANTGMVIIGGLVSPASDAKLAVNGNVYAKKLTITNSNWADYVFAPSYKLRSLRKVELFIHKNNHLPELPSAAEVEKSGIDIGSNQVLLLKKVEELTLYAIDQAKKQEAQEKLIKDQAKMLQLLNKEIEILKNKSKK